MRKIEIPIDKVFELLAILREEQGTTGWLVRERIADAIGAEPPTLGEVAAYVSDGKPLPGDDPALAGRLVAVAEAWAEIRYREAPIAQFMACWDDAKRRVDPYKLGSRLPRERWLVTPPRYR